MAIDRCRSILAVVVCVTFISIGLFVRPLRAGPLLIDKKTSKFVKVTFNGKQFGLPADERIISDVLPDNMVINKRYGRDPHNDKVEVVVKYYDVEDTTYYIYFARASMKDNYWAYNILEVNDLKKRNITKKKDVIYQKEKIFRFSGQELVVGKEYLGDNLLRIIDKNFPDAVFQSDQSIRLEYGGYVYKILTDKTTFYGPAYYDIIGIYRIY